MCLFQVFICLSTVSFETGKKDFLVLVLQLKTALLTL